MSRISSIEVFYYLLEQLPVRNLLDIYLDCGWNINDYGKISLRPLGDKDDFDWIEIALNQTPLLYETFEKKVEANEDPAVVLHWKKSKVGAIVTFFPKEKKIDFLLMFNRKIHPHLSHWTDVNWYLPKIVQPLLENKIRIQNVKYYEDTG